jgi:hypothetical protein
MMELKVQKGKALNYYGLGKIIPPNAVFCGRPDSKKGLPDNGFGNPHWLRNPGVLAERLHCIDVLYVPGLDRRLKTDAQFRDRVRGLHGKDGVCFCAPLYCHVNPLLDRAEWLYNNRS